MYARCDWYDPDEERLCSFIGTYVIQKTIVLARISLYSYRLPRLTRRLICCELEEPCSLTGKVPRLKRFWTVTPTGSSLYMLAIQS